MLPNRINLFDQKTVLVMRKARKLQQLSKELSRNINYHVKSKVRKAKITDNPEDEATKYRQLFNLTEERQKKFKTPYEFLNYLRDILENFNIYLFQFSMPVEDARGFVFSDGEPNVIVINTKDSIEARIFSLMHEFAHILLGQSVIDLPDVTTTQKDDVEKWCNIFSSAFLLPKAIAKKEFDENKDTLTQKSTLKKMSNRYKVSKAMLLLNMFKLQYIQKDDYDAILGKYKELSKVKKQKEKKGGGIPSEIRCLSEVGNKFVSLVANNYDRKHITYTDALSYLSIKSRNFDKVLSKARK
ncbi:MAG: ImmA/IrrE family metallo-endopeptidase [Nanoarchaeota archaeon]|nr:ImmA/IrrE family metallo-endopeptidase [Nanoarchaeota archaeon]